MWPTYFIPMILGGIRGIVGVCGRDDTGPSPMVVSLDLSTLNLQSDDVLLLFMYAAEGVLTPEPAYCTEATDWKPIHNGSLSLLGDVRVLGSLIPSADAEFSNSNPVRTAVAWRRWQSGDPTTYTFYNENNDVISACIYGIRGVHLNDPFPYIIFYPGSNTGGALPGSQAMPPNPMPHVEGCVRLDVAQYSNSASATSVANLRVPTTDDILFFGYELPEEDGSGTIDTRSGLFYVLRAPVAGEANNLLPHSQSLTDWTKHGLTVADTALAGITYNRGTIAIDPSVNPRELRQTFTCGAGKYYCLWSIRDRQSSDMTQGYLRDGTFYGARRTDTHMIVDGTDTLLPAYFPVALELGNQPTGAMGLFLTSFGGFEADTEVTLVMGFCNPAAPYARSWAVGAARNFNMHAFGLAEIPSLEHVPALIENTTDAPLTGVNMTHAAHCYPTEANFNTDETTAINTSTPTFAFTLMVRGLEASAPTLDLREQQWLPHDFNHLSATAFETYKTGFKEWSMARRIDPCSAYAHCPRPAIPNVGHDKLYCEFTIVSIGTLSATPLDPWVYVQTIGDGSEHAGADRGVMPRSVFTATARDSTFGWNIKGSFSEHGTVTANDAAKAFTAGDVLGVGVNFADEEVTYYKNGALVHTTAMDANRSAYWLGTGIAFGEGSRTNHFPKISVNWTGPFGGRKPAGFEAWDWPNEVT